MNSLIFNSVMTNGDAYAEMKKEEIVSKAEDRAAHCCLFARAADSSQHAIMMQVRTDGMLGFPGGVIDEGESQLEALNRELREEINLDLDRFSVQSSDHLVSHYNLVGKRFAMHFYTKEVTEEEFAFIEQNAPFGKDFSTEVSGIFRVPLSIDKDGRRGLPEFLKNNFIGNARDQLLYALGVRSLLPIDVICKAVKSSCVKKDYAINKYF